MNKKFKITVSLIAIFVLIFGLNSFAFASNEYEILSQGRFVDRNGTEDTSDDTVLFDSRDLVTLKTMVETGKTKLSTAINEYPNTNVQPLDTFDNLSSAINNLTSVPDVYYYDKATEGDSCARYMYENGSYYPCNEYGEKTSNTKLTGTITVVTKEDTREAAAGETLLVKYESTSAANLSAGSAGFADKFFILGSGSDNITYRNLADATINPNSNNYKAGIAATKVGTATAAQVLTGKTFTNASGVGISGTMPNHGAWTNTPTGSGKVTIPAGYHNGNGYVDTTSIYNVGYVDGMNGLECVEYLSGTVGSGNFTAESPILFITLIKGTSGSFPWTYYYEGSPVLNMQTYTVIRGRDDGYQDHFNHTVSSFSLGTLSADGKTIIFSADYYGYNYKIYY